MPSLSVTVSLVLIASIGALFWLMALAQRQFEPSPRPSGPWWSRHLDHDAIPRTPLAAELTRAASWHLSQVVAPTMEPASRIKPRNSAEVQALAALRSSLALALQGEFAAEVRTVIDSIDGVQAWHDIRKLTAGGPSIAHLAVGSQGVFVIDSVVGTSKLSYDGRSVYSGRGSQRSEVPMIDELLVRMAALEGLVEPAPVHGIIVVEDHLTLPPQIRSRGVTVRGVRLLTPGQLPAQLTTGVPLGGAVDVEAIWARLFPAFGPAVDSPDHPFAATAPALSTVGQ